MRKKLLNKKVKKITVGELRKALQGVDDGLEVVLGFYRKNDGVWFGYLAEVLSHLKYDSVKKEELNQSTVVELVCYDDEYCTYVEKSDE